MYGLRQGRRTVTLLMFFVAGLWLAGGCGKSGSDKPGGPSHGSTPPPQRPTPPHQAPPTAPHGPAAVADVIPTTAPGSPTTSPPYEAPPAPPDVAQEPAVEVIDLNNVETALASPADTDAALSALAKLDAALETEGALADGERGRAEELRSLGSFAVIAHTALAGGDLARVSAAVGLEGPAVNRPSGAFTALGKRAGEATVMRKAAAMLAWLSAPPEERKRLPAPTWVGWRSLVADDAPAGVAVRAATLKAFGSLLTQVAAAPEAERPVLLASGAGPLVCAACDDLADVPAEERAAKLYSPDNLGYVCAAAREALADKPPRAYPATLAGACRPSDYGLSSPAEMSLLTAGNAIVLRALALATAARKAPADGKSPLASAYAEHAEFADRVLAHAIFPLALPWLPIPAAEHEAAAARVLPPNHLASAGTRRPALPLETIVVDENGVAAALRPLAAVRNGAIALEDAVAGFAFPGKQLIAATAVEESDKKRDEEAKASGEKIEDPDAITEVVAGIWDLGERAATFAEKAFAGTDPSKQNVGRPKGDRSALLAVDAAAPSWLLRRTLASMRQSGFKRPLLHKPDPLDLAADRVLPIVFRDTENLPEGMTVQNYERPIIVYVAQRQVRVFPPHKRTTARAAGRPTPAERLSWPRGAREEQHKKTRKLFAVIYRIPDANEPLGPAVAQIVGKLASDSHAGNMIYLMAADDAPAGRLLEVADTLSSLPGPALSPLDALEPGLRCDGAGCPSRVVVLFPQVRIPRQPGERRPPHYSGPPGFCSRANIKKVIGRRSGTFRFCYERELQLQPELSGRLEVRFVIGLDGRVGSVSIANDTVRNRKVKQCVTNAFRRMRFDPPEGGVCRIKWPLRFTR